MAFRDIRFQLSSNIPPNKYYDYVIGVVLCICFFFGTIANGLVFMYFVKARKDVPNKIYRVMSATDCVICATIFTMVTEAFMDRKGILYQGSDTLWCKLLGLIWSILPYFYTFQILLLSVLRTCCLLWPFNIIPSNVPVISSSIFIGLLILKESLLNELKYVNIKYSNRTMSCKPYIPDRNMFIFYFIIITNFICFTVPIILIIASDVISYRCIWRSQKRLRSMIGSSIRSTASPNRARISLPPIEVASSLEGGIIKRKMKQKKSLVSKATETIIIVTVIYVIFRIPSFISDLLILIQLGQKLFLLQEKFGKLYISLLFFEVAISCNAAVNPIIHFWRIEKLRNFFVKTITGKRKERRISNAPDFPYSVSTNSNTRSDRRLSKPTTSNIRDHLRPTTV